jgi:hypothetical protein
MKKLFLLSIVMALLSLGLMSFIKRKKNCIKVIQSSVIDMRNTPRQIGMVYEFDVQLKCNAIVFDSVWFGNTPVPCDAVDLLASVKVDTCYPGKTYRIRANKELYQNFPGRYDSSLHAKQFKPPFAFRGVAVVFYRYKGKRSYLVINKAEEKTTKPMRQ